MPDELIGLLREPDLDKKGAPLPYPTLLQDLARQALESRPLYDYRGRTAREVEARLREVRRIVRSCLHLPTGAVPGKPVRVIERRAIQFDGFSIQPVVIERVSGWYVTAHLYIPDGLTQPAPAVMHVHGHSYKGKSTDFYARRCRGLARHGFVSLFVDFPGADEREPTGHALWYPNMANLPLQRIMVEDNSAAFTYLASLPFVDGKRIGVTGSSGGGNQTAFFSAVDERVAAAAPTNAPCLIAEHAAAGSGAYCHCEAIPGLVAAGVEYHDLLAAMAPRPLRVFAGIRDPLFPIIGARRAVAEAAIAYKALGARGKCALEEHYCDHSCPEAMREGTYGFFERALKRPGDVAGPRDEGEDIDLADPRLRALPKRPARFLAIADLYRNELRKAKPKRLSAQRLNALLGRKPGDSEVVCMVGGERAGQEQSSSRLRSRQACPTVLLRMADGGVAPVVMRGAGRSVTVVVSDGGKAEALRQVKGPVVAFDWRGQGETTPSADEWQQRATHYLSYAGRTLPGGRVTDLIGVVRWLRESGHKVSKVLALGGGASLIALFAASAEREFPKVELHGLPRTLKEAPGLDGQVKYTAWVPGLAMETDVPHLLRALGKRAVVRGWLKPGEERGIEGYS
ncbi:MAG: alpha/beta hydrolase family protein [Armatimonadota bacterium]